MKASKLLLALLSLAAVFAFFGCGDPIDPPDNEPADPDGWKTVWVANVGNGGWIHFHAGYADNWPQADNVASSIKIQRIYLNSKKSKTGAATFADFTSQASFDSFKDAMYALDNPGIMQFINYVQAPGSANGMYSNTKAANEASVWSCIGSSTIVSADYIGFLIKVENSTAASKTALGQSRIFLENALQTPILFADLLDGDIVVNPDPPAAEPPAVAEWTLVSYELPAGVTDIELHVQSGNIEIQKIFVNNTADASGSPVYLFDFTKATWAAVVDSSVSGENVSRLQELWTAGTSYKFESHSGYGWGGRFVSTSLTAGKYISFIIKSTGLGITRFQMHGAAGNPEVHFASILPESDFVPVTHQLPAGVTGIKIHTNGELVEIQKIFVNNTASASGATVLFDFTKTTWAEVVHSSCSPGEGTSYGVLEELWTPGKSYKLYDSGYGWGGWFTSTLLTEGKYLGFIVETTLTGGARFELVGAGGEIHFASLLPPKFVAVTKVMPAGVTGIKLHANDGPVEIQKIFVNTTASDTGAIILFDFTKTTWAEVVHSSCSPGEGSSYGVLEDNWTSGESYILDGTAGYAWGGWFASTEITEGKYLGFIINPNVAGGPRFELAGVGGETHFVNLLP